MLWIKAFHIIFVVCWFAGIFYLPRLFVNQAMAKDPATQEHLALMSYKLYRFMTPLAWLALGFGVWMTALNWSAYQASGWFHVKMLLVILLIAYHWQCGRFMRAFQAGTNTKSHLFFRWFNEVPVLLLFAVVILVVVRPF